MKCKPLPAFAGALVALALGLTLPPRSSGQAGNDDAALAAAVAELVTQHAQIVEGQAKIDEKIAIVAEDIRVARLFVARGGGKTK